MIKTMFAHVNRADLIHLLNQSKYEVCRLSVTVVPDNFTIVSFSEPQRPLVIYMFDADGQPVSSEKVAETYVREQEGISVADVGQSADLWRFMGEEDCDG